jgi:hypothetical protein
MKVRIADGAAGIGKESWNACANPDGVAKPHPFTRFEFFHALEASGSALARTGWQPAHLCWKKTARSPASCLPI